MLTMTINEFMKVQRGQLSYREIERERFTSNLLNRAEIVSTKINENTALKTGIVFILALSLISIKANAAVTTPDFKGVDEVGRLFLYVLRRFGYWICLGMAMLNVIKSVAEGERTLKGVSSGSLKYLIAFALFYILPMFFDMIEQAFGGV